MRDIPLTEFLKSYSQAEAAKVIGVNQSAISQMLAAGREIYIRQTKGGFESYEVKPIGKKAS